MARLFNRTIALTVSKVTKEFSSRELVAQGVTPEFNRRLVATSTESTTIRDLRVVLEIEKHISKEPNTCELTIYNLSKDSRARFQDRPLHIRLDVGYDGGTERLFVGDLRWVDSKHIETEWETRMLVGDGERAYRFGRVSRSFKGGVTLRTALTEAAKEMGMVLPPTVTSSVLGKQFVSGLTMHGPAANELTRLLAPHGLGWSIQDGRLQILDAYTARPDEALLINQSTGMIGTPEYGTPDRKGRPPVMTFRTLLKPGIIPGGKVMMESRSINGVFRVERVRHSGDTHGDVWESVVECRQVKK